MFCTQCGAQLQQCDNFCAKCGKASKTEVKTMKPEVDPRICNGCKKRMHSDQYYCCQDKPKKETTVHPDDRYL